MHPNRTSCGLGVALLVVLVSACSSGGDADVADGPATSSSTLPAITSAIDVGMATAASLETVASIPPTTAPPAPAVTTPLTPEPEFAPVDGAPPRGLLAPLQTPIEPPVDLEADEPLIELGTIEIPKIGLVVPLLEGIRLSTFDRGAGHWPGTAMPGYIGNAVVGGHRTSAGRPFHDLDQLVPGDEVVFNTPEGRFVYAVTGSEIVDPEAMPIVRQTLDFTATLFACHPPGSTDERIVVHLTLTDA